MENKNHAVHISYNEQTLVIKLFFLSNYSLVDKSGQTMSQEVEERTIKRFRFQATKPTVQVVPTVQVLPNVQEDDDPFNSSFIDIDAIEDQAESVTIEGKTIVYDVLVPNGMLIKDHPHFFPIFFSKDANTEAHDQVQEVAANEEQATRIVENPTRETENQTEIVPTIVSNQNQLVPVTTNANAMVLQGQRQLDRVQSYSQTQKQKAIMQLGVLILNQQELLKNW